MSTRIEFVKGHCGWDAVTLIPDGQLAPDVELAAAVKMVMPPVDGGLEAGFLGCGDRPGTLRLRMVNSTSRGWITMCGGMSQVIGKALVETFLRDRFDIDASGPTLEVTLQTPCGDIPIHVDIRDHKVVAVTTSMDAYLAYLYGLGIEAMELQGVQFLRVGDYAVLDVRALEAAHPGLDFTRRDFGPHLHLIHAILHDFRQRLGLNGVNGMLYDDRPEGPGQFRVFPRFYSDDLAAAYLPWEFQCGTGSVAVAVALARAGHLSTGAAANVLLEWGSYRATRDPYGIRTSKLSTRGNGQRLTTVSFSHSVIEILAEGTLTLPEYTECR